MTFEMEAFDSRAATDEQVARYHGFASAIFAERQPDEPPLTLEEAEEMLRRPPSYWHPRVFAVPGDNGWVGVVRVIATERDPDNLRVDLAVSASHRRRGIGRALLESVVAAAAESGHGLLYGDSYGLVPAGAAFAAWLGAQPGLDNHVNRLLLAEVDRPKLAAWIEEGPRRAPGYEITGYDGRCPDELLAGVAEVMNVIQDAPTDDLVVKPIPMTPEVLRVYEDMTLADGTEWWWLVARERATGAVVGGTDVRWNAKNSTRVIQGFTGVRRDHRGHGLGIWLKASMLARILDQRPGAVDVVTSNADSNDAMGAINRQLGFKPYLANTTWQMRTTEVQETLSLRTRHRSE